MQSAQVSIWVPIAVGVIGVVGVVLGQAINSWREHRGWQREQEREDLRWKREADETARQRAHDGTIDWRDRRLAIYSEFLYSISEVQRAASKAAGAQTMESMRPLLKDYQARWQACSEISERARIVASDEIVSIVHVGQLNQLFPIPHFPRFVSVNPSPETLESWRAEDKQMRQEMREAANKILSYHHKLTEAMRHELGVNATSQP